MLMDVQQTCNKLRGRWNIIFPSQSSTVSWIGTSQKGWNEQEKY